MKKTILKNIKMTFISLKLIVKNARLLSTIFVIIEIIISISPFVTLLAIRNIANQLVSNQLINYTSLLIPLLVFIIANGINTVIEPIRTGIVEIIQDKVAFETQLELLKSVNNYQSIELFEFSSFYNEIKEAEAGSGNRMISVLQLSSSMFRGIITTAFSAYLFIELNWWIGILTILSIIPTTYYGIWASRNRVNLFRSQSEPTRKLSYYKNLIVSKDAAKEVRLFRLGNYIVKLYKDLFHIENKKLNKVRTKNSIIGVFANIISSIVIGFAVIYFVNDAIKSQFSIGDIILYIGIIPQFGLGLRSVVNAYIYTIDNNRYVNFYYNFIKKSKQLKDISSKNKPEFEHIKLEDISFQYPNSNNYALKHIDIEVSKSGLVAIVGKNGAGKSTLMKILLRLYKPTSGQYYVDHQLVDTYSYDDFRKKQSGVFQDFIQMSFSVSDNVWFGNIDNEKDLNKISEAMEITGVKQDVNHLEQGFDSVLGKEFTEGSELSKGQWQKLVWARAIYSDSNFLIFDEPTSAIDPETEKKLFDLIIELSQNKLVFLISHRLSSVIKAKQIIVLDQGEIIEKGTHEELIKNNKLYRDLFEKQASGYTT